MHFYQKGPLLIVIAAILWALDGIVRRSLFDLPPLTIVFYEHLFGAVILAPFVVPLLRARKPTAREWSALVWVSIVSGLLGTLWFTTALARVHFISFSLVFLIQKLQPIFSIATARLLLKERISAKYVGWSLLALIAAFFVTFPNGAVNISAEHETSLAALYALGAALAWGSSTAVSRYALLKQSGTLVTGIRFLLTTAFAALFAFVLQPAALSVAPQPDQFGRLAIITVSTGMVALWIYYQGLKRTQAKIAAILELVFPLVAVFVDIFFYHTLLEPSQYVAAVALLFAVHRVSLVNRETRMRFVADVIPGRGEGKKIGFPTLNMRIPKSFPFGFGVYAGRFFIGEKSYIAAIHYGPVPVFQQSDASLEAYVLDESFDEVPSDLSFEMLDRLRDIREFDSMGALARQIEDDVKRVRRMTSV